MGNMKQLVLVGAALLLAGCAAGGSASNRTTASLSTGPSYLSSDAVREKSSEPTSLEPGVPPLDIVVSVFDPGLPDDPEKIDAEDWPELRRAEARYLAVRVRDTLVKQQRFGAVRVTPDASFTSDLFLEGEIVESNGEDMKLKITVTDSTGKRWYSKVYSHRTKQSWYKNLRNKGFFPFQPIYNEIAADLVKRLDRQRDSTLSEIHVVTDMRFAQNLSPDAFTDSLTIKRGRARLHRLPAQNDPMIQRVSAVRYRDQMFVDNMQEQYDGFSASMMDSYRFWQEQSGAEVVRRRDARTKAVVNGLAGIALIAGAVAAGSGGYDYAALAAGLTGGVLLANSWKDGQEARVHSSVIDELAESLDSDLAPKVIEMEDQTVTLTGNLQEQVQQWRAVLAKIWEVENLPETEAGM
jgi:hypothetical protein